MSDDQPQQGDESRPETGATAAATESTRIEVGGSDQEGGSSKYQYGLYKMQTRFDPVSIVFTLLVFIGGIIGYVNKQSSASLIAGTVFALLLAAATYVEGARKNPYPLLVILVALGGMMAYRYSQSGNFMPSGLVAALAILMIARHSYLMYLRRQPVSAS